MDRSVTLEKSDLNNTNFLENQDYYLNLISELMNIRKRGEVPLAYIHTYGCQQNVADSEKLKVCFQRQVLNLQKVLMMRTLSCSTLAQLENMPRIEYSVMLAL